MLWETVYFKSVPSGGHWLAVFYIFKSYIFKMLWLEHCMSSVFIVWKPVKCKCQRQLLAVDSTNSTYNSSSPRCFIASWSRNGVSRLTTVIYFSDWSLMTILKALLIFGNDIAWLLPWCTRCGWWFCVRGDGWKQIIFIVSCHSEVGHLLTFENDS